MRGLVFDFHSCESLTRMRKGTTALYGSMMEFETPRLGLCFLRESCITLAKKSKIQNSRDAISLNQLKGPFAHALWRYLIWGVFGQRTDAYEVQVLDSIEVCGTKLQECTESAGEMQQDAPMPSGPQERFDEKPMSPRGLTWL
jgi:hypothetical protein